MNPESVELLLVEDNPDDVEFFTHTFLKAGLAVRVQAVPDGAEALDYIYCAGKYSGRTAELRPRVIILDLKLPKVAGLEVLRKLKSDPATRSIPVVVLSSSQEARDLVESYQLGVNSFIVKPMEFDEYGQAVRMIGYYWLHYNQIADR